MNDDSADWILRRTTDYQFVERIAHLEAQQINNEEIEKRIQEELKQHRETLADISQKLNVISAMQAAHEPMMHSLDHLVGAGMVFRWVVIFIVGAMAAIGTATTAWESVHKWFR